ncbi:MAG: DUF2845 domain-containing protein, partial [Syntrophales bacterium]|nr:DUF2845 domain-containing protein [Syntrophales bacterium]
VVLVKCGKPLSKSQDTADSGSSRIVRKTKPDKQKQTAGKTATTGKTKPGKPAADKTLITRKTTKERGETWTYNIDGSYRFFIFKEGKLSGIETGGLVN